MCLAKRTQSHTSIVRDSISDFSSVIRDMFLLNKSTGSLKFYEKITWRYFFHLCFKVNFINKLLVPHLILPYFPSLQIYPWKLLQDFHWGLLCLKHKVWDRYVDDLLIICQNEKDKLDLFSEYTFFMCLSIGFSIVLNTSCLISLSPLFRVYVFQSMVHRAFIILQRKIFKSNCIMSIRVSKVIGFEVTTKRLLERKPQTLLIRSRLLSVEPQIA